MKKSAFKISICAAVFFASIFIISAITNRGNTDMTVEMDAATYPLIYMNSNGEEINCLHGYAGEMETSYLRDTITPIDESRRVLFRVDKFGRKVKGITAEIRSMDGSRLVEATKIEAYEETKEDINASFVMKDLIDENQEYMLILIVDTDRETIQYYTRVVQTTDYMPNEKLAFAKEFHEKIFTKDQSISQYLEPNAEGDNTTYQKVTIHSSFNQVTWGDLAIEKISEPILSIKELGLQSASICLNYFAKVGVNTYRISEFYRLRLGSERVYLLDYERTMNQFFEAVPDSFANNKIMLGIAGDVAIKESEDGNVIAFNQENSLYCYNATDSKVIRLFSFYNPENGDLRDVYNKHNMKILSVEETGNVRFLVYGYMNRGRHEGNVGVQIYYYNHMLNTIEEDAFLSYTKSYELLREDIEKLSYVSKNNIYYFILDGTIYSVDLSNKTSSIVATALREDRFRVSAENDMIVWQTGEESFDNKELILMNLNTKRQTQIHAGSGNRIAPLGFMGSDLIYGIADEKDVIKDHSGLTTFPMNRVMIQNENGDILKQYKQDGVYVTQGSIQDNLLTLKRVRKTEEIIDEEIFVQYEEIEDDQIMNNMAGEIVKNSLTFAATEKYENITEIVLKNKLNIKALKILEPKEVLFEGGREISLPSSKWETKRYYVYAKNGVEGVYTEPAPAIKLAEQISGAVVNDYGNYIWSKGNLALKNQIMKIEPAAMGDNSSIAVCLDTVLSFEGVTRNTEYLLNQGDTVYSILENNLENAQILMLLGCSLDSVLYYVNKDIPVMALLEDGNAVLVIGFNELNTVLMDPMTGTIYKKGMNDSKIWFEENGNRFITYVKQ